MTRGELVMLAKEAGFSDRQWSAMFYDSGPYDVTMPTHTMERFAELIAKAEREECAKVCEEHLVGGSFRLRENLAAAIRARCDK